ncbi:hypothetical protein [Neisseria lactamica]|uniref:hypothetical protein n=1 Tax=Neisseria lactamica TaxID=486 RepID=UPI0013B46B1F|nr:hypothetical protein [Neisseria lactamica]
MQFGLRQGSGFLIPFVTSGIAEFVGNGRCGLGGVFIKLLRYFPLQVDLFGHRFDGLSVVLQESKGRLKGFTSFQTAF